MSKTTKMKQQPLKKATKTAPKGMEQPKEKNYKWEPEDTFEFNGVEFSSLYNSLQLLHRLLGPSLQAFQTLQSKFEEEIKSGKIKEM